MSDHALAILGFWGTLVFGVVSVALGWRSLVRKSLTWGSSTEFISTGTGQGELSISFEGRHFAYVCITRLAIWNQGRGSIAGTEISRSDALRVQLPEGAEILSASVIGQTGDGVAPSVAITSTDKAVLLLMFDILNEGDGFTIRVLHHGSKYAPALFGTIRDVHQFQEISITTDPFLIPRRILIMASLAGAAFAAIILALGTLLLGGVENYFANLRTAFVALGVAVGVLSFTIMTLSTGGRLPKPLLRGFSDLRK